MHNLKQCAYHKIFRHDVRKECSSTNNSLTVVGEVRCDPIAIDFVQSRMLKEVRGVHNDDH